MSGQVLSNIFWSKPAIHSAKKQLSYPLYGADFDPLNHHFLLVGGGGGSSATGVPNRISLLDTSNRSEIKEVSDIELAPDEDSVTSLAIADSDAQSVLAFAGINSSVKDVETGKNEHFRSFRVPLPGKRRANADEKESSSTTVGSTQPLARTSLFRSAADPKSEAYQRVLRLSPPVVDESIPAGREGLEKPTRKLRKRLATIAPGFATQNEVVTLPVSEAPSSREVLTRVNLEKKEAQDVDLTNVDGESNGFALAFCTDTELYLQQLSGSSTSQNTEPKQVYETLSGPKGRTKIRALRFLNPRYLLLLQNRANRGGSELIVLKVSKDYAQATQVLVKSLKSIKQAVGLDTCTLSKGQDGSQQFVLAVAGQDSSLQVHTVDWISGRGITSFSQYADIVDLHNGPITKVVFSNFIGPQLPISSQTPVQWIRLATVGVDKNVVVQTFPLRPTPASGTGNKKPRYVLIAPTETGPIVYSFLMGLLTLLIGLSMVLTFLELRGAIPQLLGSTKYLPQKWQDRYGQAYPYGHDNPGPVIPESMPGVQSVIDKIKLSEATPVIEKLEEIADRAKMAAAEPAIESLKSMQSSIPSLQEVQDTLVDLVSQKEEDEGHADKAVIIRDLEHLGGELTAELKHEADVVKEETLKKWENLSKKEQKNWKEKLKSAGQWTEQQGETVLKGVFFGQLAGIVGEMVRG